MATPPADKVRRNRDGSPEQDVAQQVEPLVAEMIKLGDELLTTIADGQGRRGKTERGKKPGTYAFYSDNGKVFILLPASLQRSQLGSIVSDKVKEHYDRQPGYKISSNEVGVIVEF